MSFYIPSVLKDLGVLLDCENNFQHYAYYLVFSEGLKMLRLIRYITLPVSTTNSFPVLYIHSTLARPMLSTHLSPGTLLHGRIRKNLTQTKENLQPYIGYIEPLDTSFQNAASLCPISHS